MDTNARREKVATLKNLVGLVVRSAREGRGSPRAEQRACKEVLIKLLGGAPTDLEVEQVLAS